MRHFLYKCSILARTNNFYFLEPRHIQHSRCNTLHSLDTENKQHRHKFIWRVYLQEAETVKVIPTSALHGSTISPQDIKCGFHTASMKHHDIKLTLARHDQSANSSAPYEDFLQLIGSWNLSLPCNMYMNFKILTREEEETSPQQLGPFTRKLQGNNKNPTTFLHLASKKSARTELDNDGRLRLT